MRTSVGHLKTSKREPKSHKRVRAFVLLSLAALAIALIAVSSAFGQVPQAPADPERRPPAAERPSAATPLPTESLAPNAPPAKGGAVSTAPVAAEAAGPTVEASAPPQDRGSGSRPAEPAAGGSANGHSNGVAPGPPPGRGPDVGPAEPAAGGSANGHSNGVAPGPQEQATSQELVLEDRSAPPVAPEGEDSTAPAALVAQAPAHHSSTAPSSSVPPSAVLLDHAGAALVFSEVDRRGPHGAPLAAAAAPPGLPAVAYPPALTLSELSFLTVWGSPTATPSASTLDARPLGSAVGAQPSNAPPLPAPGGATASGGAAGAAATTLFAILLSLAAYCLLHHMRLRVATGVCRPQAFVAVIERPG